MSDVNASDSRIINGVDDVWHEYQGADDDCRAGIEVELAFFDPKTPDLTPMTRIQNKAVKDTANDLCGVECVRSEPSADMLEVGSIARRETFIQPVLDDMNARIKHLVDVAADNGLKRSPFQENPHAPADMLFKQVVDVERYQAFFNPPRADMMGIARYFFSSKSDQVSVSYRDMDHMLGDVRRLYFLAPFLYMLTDNSSGFDEAKEFTGHAGMRHRASLKARGGVPPYVYTAKSGETYMKAHIDHVMNNPMYVFYDLDGVLQKLPSGTWTSFNELKEKGLNTAANYHLAESILWPDVKIAALKDQYGNVYNHRYEARMFGVGIHQHQTAFLITAGLAFFQEFAQKVDRLLVSYGFCPTDPSECCIHLESAYAAAMNHDNKFFDIAYGSGRMANFAKAFADLLEDTYTGKNLDAQLAPALHICRTGQTDSKINRSRLHTMDDIMAYMRRYDPAIFENPNMCKDMLFNQN